MQLPMSYIERLRDMIGASQIALLDENASPEYIREMLEKLLDASSTAVHEVEGLKKGSEQLMHSLRFQTATAERDGAYQAYNYAASKLELLKIKERMAESLSQYEPCHSIGITQEQASSYIGFLCNGRFIKKESEQ